MCVQVPYKSATQYNLSNVTWKGDGHCQINPIALRYVIKGNYSTWHSHDLKILWARSIHHPGLSAIYHCPYECRKISVDVSILCLSQKHYSHLIFQEWWASYHKWLKLILEIKITFAPYLLLRNYSFWRWAGSFDIFFEWEMKSRIYCLSFIKFNHTWTVC